MQGFRSNRLIVAIPFVCKVLEQTKESKVFQSPNPWLMAILRLLVELYQFAELKLNLKFEIEVLCKNIAIELKGTKQNERKMKVIRSDIEPSNLLHIDYAHQEQEQRAWVPNEVPSQVALPPAHPRAMQQSSGALNVLIGNYSLASCGSFCRRNREHFHSQLGGLCFLQRESSVVQRSSCVEEVCLGCD